MRFSTIPKTIFILSILLAILATPLVRGDENNVVYATATVHVSAGYLSGVEEAYGSLKVEVPRYLLVDRENEIKVIFDASTCLTSIRMAVSIAGKVPTTLGEKEIVLGGVDFDFGCSSTRQVKTTKIMIPSTIYKESTSKTIAIYVKDVITHGSIVGTTVKIISNIPAEALLVLSAPVPQVSIVGLDGGALYLRIGETKSFTVSVASLNAPILINDVKIDVPSFAVAYVNTPLPLNIGVNETRPIVIAVRGSNPGAGVVRVNIVYYNGAENRELVLYVPVVVEEERIYSLIDEYNRQIQQMQSKISQLEEELGIKISNVSSFGQRLDSIIVALNNLTKQYSKLVGEAQTLTSRYQALEQRIQALENNLRALSNDFQRRLNNIEQQYSTLLNEAQTLTTRYEGLEQKVQNLEKNLQALSNDFQRRLQEIDNHIQNLTNETRDNVQSINNKIGELSTKVSELEHSLTFLRAMIMAIAVVAIACAIWVIVRKHI